MSKKLRIYINISENSGVGYYRQYLPALALRELGHDVLINDFTWGENRIFCRHFHPECKHITWGYDTIPMVEDFCKHLQEEHAQEPDEALKVQIANSITGMVEPAVEMLNKIGHWADIIHFGRRDVPEYLSQWGGLREFFNVPIVVDTDDNVHATRPFNPGYRGYHPGSQAFYWNKKTASEVNAITVSTENLRQVHLRDNPNIYVLPNSLDFDRWAKAKRPEHDEIRIGCLLSSSHHEDAQILKNVIPAILKKYPNVHFYYTSMYSYLFDIPEFKSQVHQVGWIQLKEWPEKVVELGLDIGLAPLVDNLFNRAKSNLRYLEYSAAKMAPIVSPMEPYKAVEHGKTGLVAKSTQDWIDCISLLVDDKAKRKAISEGAYNYVKTNFDIKNNVKQWVMVYNKIIKDFKKSHGKRKFKDQLPPGFFPPSLLS